jgi:hypothetical protein
MTTWVCTLKKKKIIIIKTIDCDDYFLILYDYYYVQMQVMVTSPPIPLEEYPDEQAGFRTVKDIAVEMLRSMDRIIQYPAKGFQVPQKIPSEVTHAYRQLQQMLTKAATPVGPSPDTWRLPFTENPTGAGSSNRSL